MEKGGIKKYWFHNSVFISSHFSLENEYVINSKEQNYFLFPTELELILFPQFFGLMQ